MSEDMIKLLDSIIDNMDLIHTDEILDEANAMSELNASSADADIDNLAAKYDTVETAAVDDELAALKASMGK